MTDQAPPNAAPLKGTQTPPPCAPKKMCDDLPAAPTVPLVPERKDCDQPCNCPIPPGGPPLECLDTLIKDQSALVAGAERAKAFVEELTAIQGKVTSAQADYTQIRYSDLKKLWEKQDKLIADLTEKLRCCVDCWECLLECRLCPQLNEIRKLEDRLNGTGPLTDKVYSLFDLQFWHQRNVTQMKARVDRIKAVLAAWEKPSDTLGDVLDKNGKLVADLPAVLASDPAKAIYDLFMTLIPRHWTIRPRGGATSLINEKFIKVCKCDDGTPDTCCGPDVGIVSLRERLVGPLPYIVDPVDFPKIICCLTSERLEPASTQLAKAQAGLAATTAEIDQTKKRIEDQTAAIEAGFTAELGNPIDCTKYTKKEPVPPPAPPAPAPTCPDGGPQGDPKQTDQTAR
jgi:hypothetical protein